ncbi:type VI secretion system tip protein VgrG [Dyadobacter arcticus]|uniref:Rhs element Vgr protein n=1 Tax=Dyadobacter arcticus TaxID=1078754 RepID=A0ABX0UP12_9BACT|nr:type VI secretion system tip protein VgrG [Dyadobacter arcticus]NIJ54701.1 Rhs element Vgr protein [Dyadobacter arcticus]
MSFPAALLGSGSNPTDRVSKKILIDDTPLSNEIAIMRFSVSKVYNKIATAKIIIDDGSVAERDFPRSNSDLFKPGKKIEIQLGYDENPTTIFKGIIIRHAVRIRNGSFLEIEAKDEAIKLAVSRKNKAFTGVKLKDSAVFEEIIGSTLKKDVEPTVAEHKQIVQYYATDWDFILTRAEANGMFVLTDDGKMVIKTPTMSDDSGVTFTYGGQNNIIEFEGELDLRRQPDTVKAASWLYNAHELSETATGKFSLSETGNLSSDDLGKILGAELHLTHSGNVSEDIKGWTNAFAMRKHLAKACGRLRVEGRPLLKPGQKIELKGVGDRFNGEVLITGILHQFNGGFLTDIQFGWAEEWFYKKEDVVDKAASGLLPGINGLQIGVVQAIIDDPEKGFRVQVQLPTISVKEDGIWARVATVDAGKNRGFFFRPEKGDEVILGFVNDDPRDAVILGMLHSQEMTPPIEPEENNPKKGIVSREGMKVIFDDKTKKTVISVPVGSRDSSKEKTFTMDQKMIEIKDEFGNSIKMDTSGISITSKKTVTVEGTPINLN